MERKCDGYSNSHNGLPVQELVHFTASGSMNNMHLLFGFSNGDNVRYLEFYHHCAGPVVLEDDDVISSPFPHDQPFPNLAESESHYRELRNASIRCVLCVGVSHGTPLTPYPRRALRLPPLPLTPRGASNDLSRSPRDPHPPPCLELHHLRHLPCANRLRRTPPHLPRTTPQYSASYVNTLEDGPPGFTTPIQHSYTSLPNTNATIVLIDDSRTSVT
ncbi:hypothetical protein PSPO01_11712 [Paraphaeosphaeria sporulosa]